MKTYYGWAAVAALALMLAAPAPAIAQMGRMMEQGKGMRAPAMMGHGKMHGAMQRWKASLTEAQRQKMDEMHLALAKSISPLKALMRVKKSELKLLVVQDGAGTKAINRKINEILDLKRKIMQKRYAHMVEMRALLTPEQRVSFDLGLIGKGGRHHKGHH